MTNAFTKGQQVTVIAMWSQGGNNNRDQQIRPVTFSVRKATVYSCGKKQMVLTDNVTGEELGRFHTPRNASKEGANVGFNCINVYEEMTEEAALAIAKEQAEQYRLAEIDRCNRLAAAGHGDAYSRVMAAHAEAYKVCGVKSDLYNNLKMK